MIRGVNKYVIEVLETGNIYYDRALLFLRPEYADVEREILEKEAKKILRNMDTVSSLKQHKKIVLGLLFLFAAVFIGLLFAAIFINIFAF